MLAHPVETPAACARDVLEALSADYRLLLITKGDLFDQERKIAESGLGDVFPRGGNRQRQGPGDLRAHLHRAMAADLSAA